MTGRLSGVAVIAIAFSLVSVPSAALPSAFQAPAAPAGGIRTQAAKLSQNWKRVRTAGFEAAGDAPAEIIQRILVQLDVYRATLVTRVLDLRTTTTLPTLVVVFKDDDGFDPSPSTSGRPSGGTAARSRHWHSAAGRNPTRRSTGCKRWTRARDGIAPARTTRSIWVISPPPHGTHDRSTPRSSATRSRPPMSPSSAPSAYGA